ncbi:MAG: Uma2 family endonuclease [Akkermansiaceae bacterium]|nr:Uma2 family endonuclease [Armatimonadota bacterium]
MVTADELLNNPIHRYNELIGGEVRALNLPMGTDRSIALAFWLAGIGMHVMKSDLGVFYGANVGFFLRADPDTVKAPDYAFVKQDCLTVPRGEGFVRDIPALVVESGQDEMLSIRISEWLTLGVKYAIDLDAVGQAVTVHRPKHDPVTLTRNDTFAAEDILNGFSLPLTKVFPNL